MRIAGDEISEQVANVGKEPRVVDCYCMQGRMVRARVK